VVSQIQLPESLSVIGAVSAGLAVLLALLLWLWYPFRRRDGEAFAAMLTLYPISRFVLEAIRQDEAGQFGTVLTISQWISILVLVMAIALWIYLLTRPAAAR
jgi:phosphatidylglycerol---prolipoprotein diacylglyceryl transferase